MIRVNRSVTRETAEVDYRTGKPLVIRLCQGGRLVKIKPKGSRTWYSVTVKQVYMMGAKNKAAEIRAEKKARREARRKEREGR